MVDEIAHWLFFIFGYQGQHATVSQPLLNGSIKIYKNVWVSFSDLACFVVGYAWQLPCQVGPWPL